MTNEPHDPKDPAYNYKCFEKVETSCGYEHTPGMARCRFNNNLTQADLLRYIDAGLCPKHGVKPKQGEGPSFVHGKWRRRVAADMERWNFNKEIWEPVALAHELEGPQKKKKSCQDWIVGFMVHLRDLWVFGPDFEEEDDWDQRMNEAEERAVRAQRREAESKALQVKLERLRRKRKEMEMTMTRPEQRRLLPVEGEESCDEDYDFC